ncbi:hypothetical protein MmiAt1_01690 [Methanimicrococcus sp. At1]|uniref:Secreted protein n=1 Tax=Methanimicrococcus hacksteinii TaxID=3028293 RepID=A0ABU3VML2_9EURY|nr:hypothetical protein [Methanimicrococcus sp. At1]
MLLSLLCCCHCYAAAITVLLPSAACRLSAQRSICICSFLSHPLATRAWHRLPYRFRLPLFPFTAVSVYRCFRLPLFPFTAVSVYRCFRLPLFPFTAVSVYRCLRLLPPPYCFRPAAVSGVLRARAAPFFKSDLKKFASDCL